MDQDEAQALMADIGFTFDPNNQRLPVDTPEQRKKFSALQRLIAAALFAYGFDGTLEGEREGVMDGLEEWAQEWLIG